MTAPLSPQLVRGDAIGVQQPAGGAVDAPSAGEAPRTGFVHDMPFKAYLSGPEVSKSKLWTAINRSPAHACTDVEESNAMALGTAIHCAVLEPDEFTTRFVRGPSDRRGLRWKELREEHGDALVTEADYDAARDVRDAVAKHAALRRVLPGMAHEVSAFAVDPITGLPMRARFDAIDKRRGFGVDLKTTTDARATTFVRRVSDLGYHAQEALYTDIARLCGRDVEAFLFVVVETAAPYAVALFELGPDDVAEGRAAMRAALDLWARCKERNEWPAYGADVQPLALPRWAYRFTTPPILAT